MSIRQLTNKEKVSMRTEVYEILKQEIIDLILVPGTSMSENETSKGLQVSRTPVREAFLRLSQEDLLTVYPQKGSFVSLINLGDLEEVRFMREHLEIATIQLACEKFPKEQFSMLTANIEKQMETVKEKNFRKFYELDDEFHSIIFKGCDKARVWDVIQNMMSINFKRVRLLSLSNKLNMDEIISQHQEIVEAIAEKNSEKAVSVIRSHLKLVQIDKEELMNKYDDYFKQD
jgi:DNA-binding GntR family transcriptional regulator